MAHTIVAADIGGTKTLIGRFAVDGAALPRPLSAERYVSADFSGAAAIVARFGADAGFDPATADAACFAVAGPVRAGRAQPPALSWGVDAAELVAGSRLRQVNVVNDLYATAAGVDLLAADQIEELAAGDPDPAGNRAVVAPGTGLGMAAMPRVGPGWLPVATEGGHATYAAQSEQQWRLRAWLAERHGHVSWERLASGPGIAAIWAFLGHDRPGFGDPGVAAEILAASGAPAAITAAAVAGRCPRCVEALRELARALGAVAGDFALQTLSTAGLYLGGGVPPRVLPFLREPAFLEAFRAKGRFEPLLTRVPVRVILEPRTALLGAAAIAARRVIGG